MSARRNSPDPHPDYETFSRRAAGVFESIPPEFRAGIAGLVVNREARSHPHLPEIWTLGECVSDPLGSLVAEETERSVIHLWYGSFRKCASGGGFDWDEEIRETVTHEIRHHIEARAGVDRLDVEDWLQDQNFHRREGRPFAPGFHRRGEALDDGAFEVDGDVFIDVPLPRGSPKSRPGTILRLTFEGVATEVAVPHGLVAGHPVYVPVDAFEDGGDLVAVFELR